MKHEFVCGWLSRDGKFYPCSEYQHGGLAEEIVDVLNIPYKYDERYGFLRGEALLESLGYVKLAQSNWYPIEPRYDNGRIWYCIDIKMTKEQSTWLFDRLEVMSPQQQADFLKLMKEDKV